MPIEAICTVSQAKPLKDEQRSGGILAHDLQGGMGDRNVPPTFGAFVGGLPKVARSSQPLGFGTQSIQGSESGNISRGALDRLPEDS